MEVLGKVPVSADFVNKNIQPHPLVEHFSYWAVRWSPLSPFPLMCLDMVNLSPPDWSSCCSRSSEIITWPDKFPTINIPLDEMKNVQRRNTRIICKFLFHHIPLLLVSQWTPLLSRNYSPYHQNPFAHRHPPPNDTILWWLSRLLALHLICCAGSGDHPEKLEGKCIRFGDNNTVSGSGSVELIIASGWRVADFSFHINSV